MNKRRLVRATAVAFGAQAVTMAVSVLTVIFIARRLSSSEYGLWQFFLLIASYGGLLHFGVCDGVYLRLGGADYSALDKSGEGTEFRRTAALQTALILVCVVGILVAGREIQRAPAIILALIYIPLFNAAAYLGHILQATDRTVEYSASVIIDRLIFALWTLLGIAVHRESFVFYAWGSILSRAVSLGYCVFIMRDVVLAPRAVGQLGRMAGDIFSGSKLMVANLSGQLVLGAVRLAVIYRYGDAEFGRISLIITLANLFLQFISQLGMVLFPSLRRTDSAACRRIFDRMQDVTGLILPISFFAYLPLRAVVGVFLPEYSAAAQYLILLLPICFLYGKTQLVGTTYLKVCGRAGTLMALNLASAAMSAALCFGSVYAGGGVWSVLLAAAVAVTVRSAMFDRVCHADGGDWYYKTVAELLLCVAFAASAALFADAVGLVVFAVSYAAYAFVHSEKLKMIKNKA